jgi:hypothetical protein
MPVLMTALAVGALALVPPADIQESPSRMDPSFVHFVPPAPTSAGNPLLRLVSAPLADNGPALMGLGGRKFCKTTLLTRNDHRP